LKNLDIQKHHLVPKHVILNEKERGELLNKFKISTRDLPRILSSDPVVEEIGAKSEDIIKVTRKSETAGEAAYYRLVIKR